MKTHTSRMLIPKDVSAYNIGVLLAYFSFGAVCGAATSALFWTVISNTPTLPGENPADSTLDMLEASRTPLYSIMPSQSTKSVPVKNFILEEAGDPLSSENATWWLDSGALAYINGGTIRTSSGNLQPGSRWYDNYAAANQIDTDGGAHPQNIFRLVSKKSYTNVSEQGYFRIKKFNLSQSPNRNETNGVLYFNRYVNQDTLYYAGIRVDGTAVVKKKYKGAYFTMAQTSVVPSALQYDRDKTPTLLKKDTWVGLKSTIITTPENQVIITLALDWDRSGVWHEVLRTTDSDGLFGGTPIIKAGASGIRTDFMDVEFENHSILPL